MSYHISKAYCIREFLVNMSTTAFTAPTRAHTNFISRKEVITSKQTRGKKNKIEKKAKKRT